MAKTVRSYIEYTILQTLYQKKKNPNTEKSNVIND